MTTLQKAVKLAAKAQQLLTWYGNVDLKTAYEETKLLEEARDMEDQLLVERMSERECIGALYIICLMSDDARKDMTAKVIDDENAFMKKLSKRNADYFSVAWWVGENGTSVAEFYTALLQDRYDV